MAAECWSCVMQLGLVQPAPGSPAPVGVCVNCGVLACSGHAQRDAVSHKWKCLTSVIAAVAAGAGVVQPVAVPDDDVVRSVEDFDERFPRLADVTREERVRYDSGDRSEDLRRATEEVAPGARHDLLALAVALGTFTVPKRRVRGFVDDGAPLSDFLPGDLAAIVSRLR